MARTPKSAVSNVPAVRASSKSIANVDAELSAEAANLKQQIQSGSGRKLKIEAGGNIQTPEGLDLGNEVQLIVVDFASRNYFYPTQYDSQNPTPPDCYAIGKIIADMKPEDDSPAKQHSDCSTCPLNAFQSGSNGRGKACKNTRELAVLLVDPENPEGHTASDAPLYTLSVPPTSLKSFDGCVNGIARSLGGPPIKAIVTLKTEPKGTYALLHFTDPVPNPDYAVHYARRGDAADLITRKPDFAAYEAQRASRAPARGRAPARPAPRVAAGGRR